jgi:hypothetical protein
MATTSFLPAICQHGILPSSALNRNAPRPG